MRERRFHMFTDRYEAGRILGELVANRHDVADGVVLGLVRGGIPVAFEVAKACSLPLDILVVRKLGVPRQEELAMGAIASGGAIVRNSDILHSCCISESTLQSVIDRERHELERRELLYRDDRAPIQIEGHCVILVDDGLATGASMKVAIRAVKERARRVIVAVPIGAKSTCEELRTMADDVVCALIPEPLEAISLFYRNFEATSDEELRELLKLSIRTNRN